MRISAKLQQLRLALGYEARLLGEIFFPRRCAVCRRIIEEGCFCASCRQSFLLARKLPEKESVDGIILLYKYQNQLQRLLQEIKFAKQAGLLPILREEVIWAWQEYFAGQERHYDYVSCIPTSPERRRQRGFDIPQEIFVALAPAQWRPELLTRVRRTLPLFELDPQLRREEVAGCFRVQADVVGRKILLCDDIYTSGSTMEEAAQTLKAAGADRVVALGFTASKDNW